MGDPVAPGKLRRHRAEYRGDFEVLLMIAADRAIAAAKIEGGLCAVLQAGRAQAADRLNLASPGKLETVAAEPSLSISEMNKKGGAGSSVRPLSGHGA